MSDLQPIGHSDFILECQRLHALHVAAIRSQDAETIEAAVEAFVLFLRYTKAGRLQEYFDNQRERA
jgi:hypothetical protein